MAQSSQCPRQSCPIPRSQSSPTLPSRAWAWCGAPAALRPCLQLTSPPVGAKVFLAGLPHHLQHPPASWLPSPGDPTLDSASPAS